MKNLKKLGVYVVTAAALMLVLLAAALVNWPEYNASWLVLQVPAVLVGGGWLVAFMTAEEV